MASVDLEHKLSRSEFVAIIVPHVIEQGVNYAFQDMPILGAVTTIPEAISMAKGEVTRRIILGQSAADPVSLASRVADVVTALNQEPKPNHDLYKAIRLYPLRDILLSRDNPSWQRLTALFAAEELVPFLQVNRADQKSATELKVIQELLTEIYIQRGDARLTVAAREALVKTGLGPTYEPISIPLGLIWKKNAEGEQPISIGGVMPLVPFGSGPVEVSAKDLEIRYEGKPH